METEGTLLCSQEPTIDPYLESDASSPRLSIQFPKIHFDIVSSTPRFSEWPLFVF